jgi:hypothetical protein
MPLPGPNPGFSVQYNPLTKELTLVFNSAVEYIFDYEGNIIGGNSQGHDHNHHE